MTGAGNWEQSAVLSVAVASYIAECFNAFSMLFIVDLCLLCNVSAIVAGLLKITCLC